MSCISLIDSKVSRELHWTPNSLWDIAKKGTPQEQAAQIRQQLERILLEPQYASFIQAAFAISDEYEKGLFQEVKSFDLWSQTIANTIAGKNVNLESVQTDLKLPSVLNKAFNALISGIIAQDDDTPVSQRPRCEAEAL